MPGPSVFVTATMDTQGNVTLDPSGSVDNQGGQVAITVTDGSLIQAGSLSANQVNISTKKGVTALSNPTGLSANAGTPATDWDSAMYWPDGYDPYTDAAMPSDLASVYVAFVANAMFNSGGQYGTDPSDIGNAPSSKTDRGTGTGDLGFTEYLIGHLGQTPPYSFDEPGGPGEPMTPQLSGGAPEAGTSLEFLGATTGDANAVTPAEASSESPVGDNYQFSGSSGYGEMPVVPVEPVGATTADYQTSITGSLTSGSTVVTVPSSSSTTGLYTGEYISGTGIPMGTTINLSSVGFISNEFAGSAVVLVSATLPLSVGETITGTGFPSGTTIVSIYNQLLGSEDLQLSAPAPFTGNETLVATSLRLSAPATVTGVENLTVRTASALSADAVFINALYVDVNEPINVGQPNNDSLVLASTLDGDIATDQTHYNNGIYSLVAGDARGYYTLSASTVLPDDSQITAQYDAITGRIIVSDVSAASGGFISLDGEIMNTNTFGELNVNSDLGQVTIDNLTSYPIVVNNVSASKSTTSTTLSGVDIIDTKQPAATEQTLLVYQPGNVIDEYLGTAGQTEQQLEQGSPVAVIQGSSTSYAPLAGLRWEWQLQTTLTRSSISGGLGPWGFASSLVDGENNDNNPWYYLDANGNPTPADATGTSSTPFGQLVTGSDSDPAFEESISGSVQNWFAILGAYGNGQFGSAPTDPAVKDDNGNTLDPWAFYFPMDVDLTLTESVKADNPIGIDFSGPDQATVTITSDTPVILAGNIANPLGNTTITAPSITQEPTATLTTNNLTLTATGGVGTAAQPLDASLTANGELNVSAGSQGAYLNLGSGALLGKVSAGKASTGYGDVVLTATNSLAVAPGLPSGTVNVTGNNITLTSTEGAIGTAAAPLAIQAYGVVNASALLDIGLNQQSGTFEVGQIISMSGDVTIDPADSPIESASGTTWASEVGDAQSQQVWQDLSLTNPSGAVQETVAAFQVQVNATYTAYWQLIDNGSVQIGVFVLNTQGLALYAGRAGLSLSPTITNPTDAQVQTFANTQYQNYVTFFNQNLASNWASSADFQTFNPSFSYVATPQQVSDLSSNAAWTAPQLMNPIAQVALNPAAGAPVGVLTPNISGMNVTLVATGSSGSIGQTGSSTFISTADLQSGTLTPTESAALASASATRDVFLVGTDGQGNTVIVPYGQQPASFTFTGIEVDPNQQLFISATGNLALTAGSTITVQATSQDLTLSQVTAGGTVNIAAQGSILSGGPTTTITTPGDLVLKVVTGTVGSPTNPLNVQQVDGSIFVYTLPNHAFLTGGATTSLTITSSTASPSTYGSLVTFTATVSDSGAGVPTGTVAFYAGATFLGQGTSLSGTGNGATSTFTTSTLAAGTYPSIVAVFTPAGHFAGSSDSLSLTVNPAPLTITASSTTKTYGQTATFATTAYTETGLVSGDSITGVAESSTGAPMSATVGTYDIAPFAAAGTGLSNYTIAYVNGTLRVNPASLTITANNDSKTYGTLKTFSATAISASGLVSANGDMITGVTESSTGAPVSATVGNYDIVPSAAIGIGLSNYIITYANGTLTVNPAPLTITALNDSKIYGTLKTFVATAFTETGLLTFHWDNITGVTETSTGAPVSATVGTYPIVVSAATGAGLSNYIITYVNGTLTVNPAPLTITAHNDSKIYGTLKTFVATAFTEVGLVTANGDTITGVTENSTGAPVSATLGTYPIVSSASTGTGLANYTITYVNGTLTVNHAPLTITANNESKPFGTVEACSPTAFTEVGLVTENGDTITDVTETSTGAPASAPVGTYPIVSSSATGNGLNNYTITYVNGTLTVNQSIIVLDPTASGALFLSGNAAISLAGGVFVDSSSSSAVSASGNANVQASVIKVHGGVQKTGNASLSPAPITRAAPLANPLSGLPLPSTSGLTNYGSKSLSGNSSATINPGIYSQINASGNAKLTMNSGLYIIEGGGFSISGNASVTGSGVTIFNAESKYPTIVGNYGSISLSGNGTFNLSPPTTGTYAGVLIFQPADNASRLSISGNASSVTGEIYAPAAQLFESGNAQMSASIVVDTLTISGNGIPSGTVQNASAATVVYTPAPILAANGMGTPGSGFIGALSPVASLATSAEEYQAVVSPMDRRNLYAEALILGRPRRGLVADSVVDDLAASLLLP